MSASAGRLIRLQVTGAATAFTAEATTVLVANKRYQITNAAKRVWAPTATITVLNGGTPVDPASDPYTINRLDGSVTFTNTASRTITLTGTYLPLSVLAAARSFSLSVSNRTGDVTVFGDTATMRQIIDSDWSASIERFAAVDSYIADAIDDTVPFVVEFSPDGGTTITWRGWGFVERSEHAGERSGFQMENVSLVGSADADSRSFTWL